MRQGPINRRAVGVPIVLELDEDVVATGLVPGIGRSGPKRRIVDLEAGVGFGLIDSGAVGDQVGRIIEGVGFIAKVGVVLVVGLECHPGGIARAGRGIGHHAWRR